MLELTKQCLHWKHPPVSYKTIMRIMTIYKQNLSREYVCARKTKNRIFLTPGKTTIFGPTQVCFKNQNSCLVNNLFRVSVVCLFVLTIFLDLKFTYEALWLSRKIQNKLRYSKNVKSEQNQDILFTYFVCIWKLRAVKNKAVES